MGNDDKAAAGRARHKGLDLEEVMDHTAKKAYDEWDALGDKA